MFNLEITPGPWKLRDNRILIPIKKSKYSDDFEIARATIFDKGTANAKAIAAVPELLAVYKAAKKVNDVCVDCMEDECNDARDSLSDAIKKLEERHA